MSFFGNFISNALGTWGYYAVFGMLAIEGFGLFFLPGETTLIAAALVAGATHQLAIVPVLLAGFTGAITGDNFSYLVGHHFGFGLIRRYGPKVGVNEKRVKFVQFLYLKYGAPIVFIGRFIMYLRSWESFLAGANGMRWRRFAVVNACASLFWVASWGLLAYFLGQASRIMLEILGFSILGVFLILFTTGWLYFRRHEEALEAMAEKALPGPLTQHEPKDVKTNRSAASVGHTGSG